MVRFTAQPGTYPVGVSCEARACALCCCGVSLRWCGSDPIDAGAVRSSCTSPTFCRLALPVPAGAGVGGVIPPARVAGSAVSSVSSIRHCLAHFKAFLLEAYVLFIDMSARKTNPSSPRSARFVPGVLFGVLLGVLGDSGALVRCPILVLENPAPLLHQMFP